MTFHFYVLCCSKRGQSTSFLVFDKHYNVHIIKLQNNTILVMDINQKLTKLDNEIAFYKSMIAKL